MASQVLTSDLTTVQRMQGDGLARIFTFQTSGQPANAIVDEGDDYLVDEGGEYIVDEGA